MIELINLGFVEIELGHWKRNNKYYLIWNSYSESFNFYKIITNQKDIENRNYENCINNCFLEYIDMFHYSDIDNKIVSYIRKERILKIVTNKEVPRCPRCGHNFFSGGYGLCKWCLNELNYENILSDR